MDKELGKYRMVYDHHTHTTYSHGKGSIMDNVKVAHERGLKSIAITDHGPGNYFYGMKMSRIPEMRADIKACKGIYPDVKVFLGVEANTTRIVPYVDVNPIECERLDIILAGYHYAVRHAGSFSNRLGLKGKRLLLKNTEMIVNCLHFNEDCGNHIDILTHPGDKGPFDIDEISRACEETGTFMEINLKHPHLSVEEIKIAAKHEVSFVISSDAHVPEHVGIFKPQLKRALEAGLDPQRIVNIALK